MPHRPPVLPHRMPSSPPSGTPKVDQFGLTVIPVGPVSVPTCSPSGVFYEELDPPVPTRIIARNPTRRTISVPLGQVVTGGMADRALATTVTIAPRTTSVVRVEPLSSRWWAVGATTTAGHLSPALSALLILAGGARPGLRSIALTVLWTAYRQPGCDVTPPSREWVLLCDSRVLAVHLVRSAPSPGSRGARPSAAAQSLAWRRSQPTEPAANLVRHVVSHGPWTELWLVRASVALPEVILNSLR
jgi:hypothetical protein